MPKVIVLVGPSQSWLEQLHSDVLVNCVVTSPSYWSQRDHGHQDQDGMEPTPKKYVANQLQVFGLVKAHLVREGNVWIVIDDTYSSGRGKPVGPDYKQSARRFGVRPADRAPSVTGVPKKSLSLVPELLAAGLVYDLGYVMRARISWEKPNAVPEPTAFDRVQRTTETIWHLVQQIRHYFFDKAPLIERGLDSTVWTIATKPFGKHRAVFPGELVEPMILSSCPEGGWVLDHNAGSGTVGVSAYQHGRNALLIELNPAYVDGVLLPRLYAAGIPASDITVWHLGEDTRGLAL